MESIISSIIEFFYSVIEQYGVLGIGIAMFAESAGIPYASVVVVLSAGSLIVKEQFSFWPMVFLSTAGITLVSLCSYFLGYLGTRMGQSLKKSTLAAVPHKKIFYP
ncbi:MAG: hypothetical protein GX764_03665 [Firmicutes bacterium]|nr:hypothetical protein [Bacillota bacterium]